MIENQSAWQWPAQLAAVSKRLQGWLALILCTDNPIASNNKLDQYHCPIRNIMFR